MKKYLKILYPLTVLIILVACSSGGNEPASEPNPTPDTPPLKEIVPENPTSLPDPTAEPTTEDDATAESGAVTGSTSPAEVDLSQVTSQPPTDSTPQIAPQPGVPDPKAAIAHEVSQDLATHLDVDVGAVHTVSVTEIEWSNSSLGCPAPDLAYADVITPGYLVTLELSDQQYTYHTDLQGNFVWCGVDGKPIVP